MASVINTITDTSSNVNLIASTAFGTCSTAAATVAKVATIQDSATFVLKAGVTVHIYFTYSNTASSPTLNVNSTGALPIYRYGTTVPSTTATTSWYAGSIVSFTYNTTANSSGCWTMNDFKYDTDADTTYSAGTGLSLSGTTFNHSNSVTAGTAGTSSATSGSTLAVPYVTYDAQGHITASGTHTHTVSGFATSSHTHGLSLATSSDTSSITLAASTKYQLTAGGSTYIFTTPPNTTYSFSTSDPTLSWGTTSTIGTAGGTTYKVTMPSLPSASDIGAASSSHTHSLSMATSSDTSSITLAASTKYQLSAGGSTYVFTTPPNTTYSFSTSDPTLSWGSTSTIGTAGGTTYKVTMPSLPSASDIGAASSSHTHTLSLATSSGTSSITLAASTKYQLTAGGSTYIFTTPSDTNTNYYHTTGSWSGLTYTATANGGAGALAFTLPTGTSSTTVAAGNHTHTTSIATSSSTSSITLAYGTTYSLTAGGTSYIFTMPTASSGSDTNVTQTASTTSGWRKILSTYNYASSASGSITSGTTNITYYDADGPAINTSTGDMYAGGTYYMALGTSDSLYTAINSAGWVSDVIE